MLKRHRMNRYPRLRVIGALLTALCVTPVLAQSESPATADEWQYAGALYLWGADVTGKTVRGSEVEVDFSDLFDALEFGVMGAFEARKGNWSVLADLFFTRFEVDRTADLSIPVGPVQVPVTTALSLDIDVWIVHLMGGYNLYSEGMSRLDVTFGARYLDATMDMFLELQSLGPGQSRTISSSRTAFDGIVGLKGNATLGEKWFLPYYVDIGAGDSDFTWQAAAGIGYRAGRVWDVALVYRHLEWQFDTSRVIEEVDFSGPTLGVIFRW